MLDAGAFVAALEYASGRTATVIGKPSPAYFEAAVAALEPPPSTVFMVGDDVETDIAGAHNAGLKTVLVKTGKYPGGPLPPSVKPTWVLDSIADLPKTLNASD